MIMYVSEQFVQEGRITSALGKAGKATAKGAKKVKKFYADELKKARADKAKFDKMIRQRNAADRAALSARAGW